MKPEATQLFVDFFRIFDSIHIGKKTQIVILRKENVTAIMVLKKIMKAIVCSPDGDTDFFQCVTWWSIGRVLWHINLDSLFNAESIFIQLNKFQTN